MKKGMLHPCRVEEAVTRDPGLQYHGIWYQEKVAMKKKILFQNANNGRVQEREAGMDFASYSTIYRVTWLMQRKYCMNFDLKSNNHFMGHDRGTWQMKAYRDFWGALGLIPTLIIYDPTTWINIFKAAKLSKKKKKPTYFKVIRLCSYIF